MNLHAYITLLNIKKYKIQKKHYTIFVTSFACRAVAVMFHAASHVAADKTLAVQTLARTQNNNNNNTIYNRWRNWILHPFPSPCSVSLKFMLNSKNGFNIMCMCRLLQRGVLMWPYSSSVCAHITYRMETSLIVYLDAELKAT